MSRDINLEPLHACTPTCVSMNMQAHIQYTDTQTHTQNENNQHFKNLFEGGYLCSVVHIRYSDYVEIRGQYYGAWSLLLICGFQGWSSRHQAGHQASLSTKPSHQPPFLPSLGRLANSTLCCLHPVWLIFLSCPFKSKLFSLAQNMNSVPSQSQVREGTKMAGWSHSVKNHRIPCTASIRHRKVKEKKKPIQSHIIR